MTARRTGAVVAVATVVVALAVAGVTAVRLARADGGDEGSTASTPPPTTTVSRETLVRSLTVDGKLGYGQPAPLAILGSGVVTWLPGTGTVVKRGKTLLRVDDRPVVLLYGVLPMYRTLSTGAKGADVRQLEHNLEALGYRGFTVDDQFTEATAAVVRRWQKSLGRERTGTVEPSWVAVATGPVRIADRKARVGGPATGDLLTYTGTQKKVVVDVEAADAGWAKVGTTVTVVLPGGKEVTGKVAFVGTSATPPDQEGGGGKPTVPVTVSVADQKALGRLDSSPVEVRYTAERRKDVLTVPVTALLALAEGGYGLEIVEAGGTRYLPVKVGLFADGRVEVSGDGLAEGVTVAMPK